MLKIYVDYIKKTRNCKLIADFPVNYPAVRVYNGISKKFMRREKYKQATKEEVEINEENQQVHYRTYW